MNDRDRTAPKNDVPPKLLALDLTALRAIGLEANALGAMVCDIDDPDCEAPSLGVPAIGADQRRTEVLFDGPTDAGPGRDGV
jgi:hypothetical protein